MRLQRDLADRVQPEAPFPIEVSAGECIETGYLRACSPSRR